MVEPSRLQLTHWAPAHTDPVRQPRGLRIHFLAPTADPRIDREVRHHIAGPDQLAVGFQFP
eukprot:13981755-Alexandrium_andersonii.AAC.1